jgi:hypothetical protein
MECALNPPYMKALGVDINKLGIIQPHGDMLSGESILERVKTIVMENAVETRSMGIKSKKTYKLSYEITKPNGNAKDNTKLEVLMPVESNYQIELRPSKSQYSIGPIRAIIPKFEAVITEDNKVGNDDYVAVEVNYQNITDTDIGKLKVLDGKCFIDKSKVFTYGQEIIKDISNDIPLLRETISYTILGLPSQPITPEQGLTSFSVKMDSGGTRTNLTFSNIFPENKSDSVRRNELIYLLKNQSIKNYINNTL